MIIEELKDNNEMYLVSYGRGSYEDWEPVYIFITKDKSKAVSYVNRFNRILNEWQDYYNKTTKKVFGNKDTKEQRKFNKLLKLNGISEAEVTEIEVR